MEDLTNSFSQVQENEEERLTKEEKDVAREGVHKRSLELEEVQRDPLRVAPLSVALVLQKPSPSPETDHLFQPRGFNRSRFVNRKCTRIAHHITLISQGIKVGGSTVCGECGRVITWEDVYPPSKPSEVNKIV